PQTLVRQPPLPVLATPQSETTWRLTWPAGAGYTAVFVSPRADQFDWHMPAATLRGDETELTLSLPAEMGRPYFALRRAESDAVVYTAVRLLPTPSVLNLRDIGGYQTASGQQVRWGRIFRSGDLSNLSEADLAYLQQLDFQLVCDLRTSEEVEKSSNRPLGGNAHYLHHPIYERDKGDGHWVRSLLLKKGRLEDVWLNDVYIARFVESRAAAFGRVLTMMADPRNHPLLLHCTAGKDRTGISIALLLALLGVPDETILADYTLSNLFYDQLLASVEADAKRLAVFGIQTADLFPILTSPASVLQETLAYIRATYGSVENYVQEKAGVTAVVIEQLRTNLLYP
ncbi:MAG: tyrosine-protein phosphatase, partial [Anaerolineales bacterium]|nr:tyrosine-protein phosphatase [Anaerolineales bacterium]